MRPTNTASVCGSTLALVLGLVIGAGAAQVGTVVDESAGGNAAAAAAQERIDALADDVDALAAEYRAAVQETRALDVYARQLETLLHSQRDEIASMRRQIDEVTVVGRQVMPIMQRMLDTLDQFVALDVPFLPEERRTRLADLRATMARADVSIAEKYRRLLEAYQIENEYGRTIEAYRGPLELDGDQRTVDFLRLGRLALLYQTLDGQQSGMWDREAKRWVPVGDEYRIPIRQGLAMARKQAAPDLIRVPVPVPRRVEAGEGARG